MRSIERCYVFLWTIFLAAPFELAYASATGPCGAPVQFTKKHSGSICEVLALSNICAAHCGSCSPRYDESCAADGNGHTHRVSCSCCVPSLEVCDGVDNDCDGAVDEAAVLGSNLCVVLPPDPSAIAPAIDPTRAVSLFEATQFLYAGSDPVQRDVAENAIVPVRAALVRGVVRSRGGAALDGVHVSVHGHAELGHTLSRADGRFDLVVNGGGQVTLRYERTGFLPAQRSVELDWSTSTSVPEVVLIEPDPSVSAIDFPSPSLQVVEGSFVSDQDGGRQPFIFIPPGAHATMFTATGTIVATHLDVHITEYTVGSTWITAMPAPLPPASAPTYCVEISSDQVLAGGLKVHGRDVLFDRPVAFYLAVDDFLPFASGTSIPLGYYDDTDQRWVAANNGIVLSLLSITGARADLDANDDGVAEDDLSLLALGIDDLEREELAFRFLPGQVLWRLALTHFSTWDANQGTWPPPGAEFPEEHVKTNAPPRCATTVSGSIIECENQVLGERIELAGSDSALNYRSDRVPGYLAGRTVELVLTEPVVPNDLIAVALEINIAGQTTYARLPPSPDQRYTFTWDGRDAYGRIWPGHHRALIRIGYVYPGGYVSAPRFGYNGAGSGGAGTSLSLNRVNFEFTLWRAIEVTAFDYLDERWKGLGGWSIDPHHTFEEALLLLGDGRRRQSDTVGLPVVLERAQPISSGYVASIAAAPDGAVYGAYGNAVYRAERDGTISTVAGGGALEPSEGVPATSIGFSSIRDIALGPDGSLYVAEVIPPRIWRVGRDGRIAHVAGLCWGCTGGGDGSPAVSTHLHDPLSIDLADDGTMYVADQYAGVRRIASDGIISRVPWSHSAPALLAAGTQGDLFVVPSEFRRCIYRIDQAGNNTLVAGSDCGNPYSGPAGEDVPATAARLCVIEDMTVNRRGEIIFTESSYCQSRVRRVSRGIVSTIYTPELGSDFQVAVGPRARVFLSGRDHNILELVPAVPSVGDSSSSGDYTVASEDGQQIFVFDGLSKRHLRTLHAATGSLLYAFGYDAEARLATITDGSGNTTSIDHLSDTSISIIAPYGQRTDVELDGDGYLSQLTGPDGVSTFFEHNASGALESMIDPRGFTHTYEIDPDGRLVVDVGAGGNAQIFSRTELAAEPAAGRRSGSAVTRRTTEGRETEYRYEALSSGARRRTIIAPGRASSDATTSMRGEHSIALSNGNTIEISEASDPRWGAQAPYPARSTVLTPSGLARVTERTRLAEMLPGADDLSEIRSLTETWRINGRRFSSSYDAATRTISMSSPAGRNARLVLDALGRISEARELGFESVVVMRDAQGRVVGLTQGSRSLSLTYNVAGQVESIVDALGRTTTFSYDAAGRVLSELLPDGTLIAHGYDAAGNPIAFAPPGRSTHQLAYTPFGAIERYEAPLLGAESSRTFYAYDGDRALERIVHPDGRSVELSREPSGDVSRVDAPNGAYAYFRDARGVVASIAAPSGLVNTMTRDGSLLVAEAWNGPVTGEVSRTFNADFDPATERVNGGFTVAFSYDADALPTAVGDLAIARDTGNGLIVSTQLAAVTDAWGYNTFGELIEYVARFGSKELFRSQLERDARGRIVRKTETIAGASSTFEYDFDLGGRLERVRRNGVLIATYLYDSNGNRIAYNNLSAAYDDRDRVQFHGSASFVFGVNGELQARNEPAGATAYEYDVFDNLLETLLPNGTRIEYVIDGRHRRIGKRVNGVLERGWLYDASARPVAELDGSGQVVSRFVYGDRSHVPAYFVQGGARYRIVGDHLGSPRLIIDVSSGAVVQRIDYDEFGVVVLDTNPGFQPFGFAGGLYDHDTQLVRFGARDYDAALGRWTTRDRALFDGGSNLYTYAFNDPVNRVDRDGRWPKWVRFFKGLFDHFSDAVERGEELRRLRLESEERVCALAADYDLGEAEIARFLADSTYRHENTLALAKKPIMRFLQDTVRFLYKHPVRELMRDERWRAW